MWSPIDSIIILAVTGCLAVWGWVATRLGRREPVIAYQPRRPVPWHGLDLLAILAFYVSLQAGVVTIATTIVDRDASHASASGSTTTEHVVGQLIAEGNVWVLLLCALSAVIVAPVAEEFFFRVLLQGWLEALQHRWRRRLPTLRRLLPNAAGPIVLTSIVFAMMHFRVGAPRIDARTVIYVLAGDCVARTLAMVFAIGMLRWRIGATAADLGWTPRKTLPDIELGIAAFLAIAVPVYAMQFGLRFLLPDSIAPDPIPLFFFAVVLGIIYHRTHRLTPLIVLHGVFNGTSLMLAWLDQVLRQS